MKNPLFLLDEVDKMGMDFRGDPSSALLEVLDPEQNHTFVDHYVEVEYDLSEVMFVATANTLNIPPALLDRMEVIRLSGYTEDEKVNIATRYLLPKQRKNNGVKPEELAVTESAIRDIIRYYTREAGVRNLERELSKICRKTVKSLLTKGSEKKVTVTAQNLDKFAGVRRYTFGIAEKQNQVGQVTGLAWTEVGGELLTIEVAVMPGKAKTITTGKLGEVMQESIQAALSVVRSRAPRLGIAEDLFQKNDIHIHLPEGATPKDGPSAGTAICTAMVSALSGVPVRADVAMTGEITLRGEVLVIGGLKEKLLAAHRGRLKTVLIPEENVKDLVEIPDNVKNRLEIVPVKWIDQVLDVALERKPEPLAQAQAEAAPRGAAGRRGQAGDRGRHALALAREREGVRGEQDRDDRPHRQVRGHLQGGRAARARRDGREHQDGAEEGQHGDAGRVRHVLRGQAPRADRSRPADAGADQDPGRARAEVPTWKSAEGCDKLTPLPGQVNPGKGA